MPAPTPEAAPLRVLVADDDRLFTMLASSSLAGAGFDVTVVRDGAEALEALEEIDIDLALVDLSMPKVDGFRLIAWMRSTPQLMYVPVVVLSARNDAPAIEEAYRLGANAYQTKPVNWALLPVHMRYVLQQSRTIAELQQEIHTLKTALQQAGAQGV